MAELFSILAAGEMHNSAPDNTQVFNDTTYSVITAFDETGVERGGITVNTTTNTITISEDGLYKVTGGLAADFASNDIIEIAYYVDDVIASTTPWIRQGQGVGNPFSAFWSSYVPLVAGNVIDLRAKNAGSGNLTPNLIRLTVSLEKDSP